MWKIVGLEKSPRNDKNLYSDSDVAFMHAPTPSLIKKVIVNIYE